MTEIAIVGLGSWGLCVLERAVSRARYTGNHVRIHVIESGQLGGGVYSIEQPDYLVLNNACGQLSLYASPDDRDDPPYAMGLHEWAVTRGYRWVGHQCVVGSEGTTIRPTDYLPRRLMGEYLRWFYDTLVVDAPANVEVVRHHAAAVDISPRLDRRESVQLDDGRVLTVDHVVLTSGHTFNRAPQYGDDSAHLLRPYPVSHFDDTLSAGAPVAIAGMGLVAFDLVTAFTVGRGGIFEVDGSRLKYTRSGDEPEVYLYSRSGVPYCAKSAHGTDPYGDYQAVICTPEVMSNLAGPVTGRRRQVDFRADLLPLLLDEMRARYQIHAASRRGGSAEQHATRRRLRSAVDAGRFDEVIEEWAPIYGSFDARAQILTDDTTHHLSSDAYQEHVFQLVADDLDEALTEGGSPVKAAQEVLRILRDQIRSVIEFSGLTLESYLDFQSNVRGRINRLEAGPPPLRSQQLLGLMEAGVVRVPFGPDPDVRPTGDGRMVLRSTRLDHTFATTVDGVVRGHLDLPSLARSASPLLNRLYTKGRLTQLSYGDTEVGSVAINEQFHPFDIDGRVQPRVSVLGVLTEGVRYFTHYLPSPRSRVRAVLDAQACVEEMLG